MNLHQIVSGAINTVNPFVPAEMQVSDGYAIGAGYKQVPKYLSPFPVSVQLQALTFQDLKHTERLNLQGIVKTCYVNGNFYGVNRPHEKGGDLLLLNGEVWYIVQPLEIWPDWCKFVINLQLDNHTPSSPNGAPKPSKTDS